MSTIYRYSAGPQGKREDTMRRMTDLVVLNHPRHMAGEGDKGNQQQQGDKGKGGEGDKGQQPPPTITQEQLNQLLATERRTLEGKLQKEREGREAAEGRLGTLEEEFNAFKNILEEAAAEAEDQQQPGKGGGRKEEDDENLALLTELEKEIFTVPPGVKDKDTYLRLKRNQYLQDKRLEKMLETINAQNKTIEELRTMSQSEKQARELAEAARLNSVRDVTLSTALQKVDCIDLEAGVILLKDRVKFDPKTGKFTYTKRDGAVTTVEEGVRSEIPNYLVKTAAQDGGSGAGGSRTTTDQKIAELETKLKTAEEITRANPNTRNMSEFQRAKRELTDARRAKAAGR